MTTLTSLVSIMTSTAEQTLSSNFEEDSEDVAAAVSLIEFCANLEDYTPTVRKVYVRSSIRAQDNF